MSGRLKGVSPIIATILLIAIAIAVGIMVTTWITHWVVTQTSDNDLQCAINTNYIVESATFNQSTALNSTILVKLTNLGSQKIYGFGAILDNGTSILLFNSSSSLIDQAGINSANQLGLQNQVYIKINLTNTTAGYTQMGCTITKLTIKNDACPSVSASTTTITKSC